MTKYSVSYHINSTGENAVTSFEVFDSPGKQDHHYVVHAYLGCSRDYEGTEEVALKCFLLEHGRQFKSAVT
jgi:hypothetical protein